MITFSANIRSASARSDDAITTSSVGIPVKLVLADEFMGLAKTLVFRAGSTTVDVVLVGDATEAVVPPDVLTTVGLWLGIGIYAADGDGNVVIPTVWASAGLIQQGTVPSGVDPSEPTPSWVAQVQSIASEASENAESALNKATAVEDAAARGDFDGRDGTDGFSPTVTVNEIPGGHEVIITDIDGEHPFDVMDGQGGGGGGAVDSVNGYTGEVWLTASDVGALPDNTTIPTKTSDLQNDSGFITSVPVQSVNGKTGAVVLNASDVGAGTYSKPSGGIPKTDLASGVQTSLGLADSALQTSGGTMSGAVAMGGYKVTGLGTPANDSDASTKKYVDDAIAGIGTVFTIKGDVAAVADLPATGNAVGDVYYVQAVSAAYVWLETTAHPTGYWEEFGEPIDLSGYIEKPSSPTANQYLKWNGSAWVAADAPVTSVNGYTGVVSLSIPSSASDVGAVASNQGSGNAGKFLVVGNDGVVVPVTMATWQGGAY